MRCAAGDARTARDARQFLLRWFDRFPQYRQNPFWLSGAFFVGWLGLGPGSSRGASLVYGPEELAASASCARTTLRWQASQPPFLRTRCVAISPRGMQLALRMHGDM